MTNETKKSDAGLDLLKDGAEISNDIPALFTAGIDYNVNDKLLTSASLYYYFDKGVDWGDNIYGQERTIESNSWELAIGLQYSLTDEFAISGGYMYSPGGVSEQYQSDFSYSQTANSAALGFEWKLSERLVLDAGVFVSAYVDIDKTSIPGSPFRETYDKRNTGIGIGIGYKIF